MNTKQLDLAQFEGTDGMSLKRANQHIALLAECRRQREEIASLEKRLHLIGADRSDKDEQIKVLREALVVLADIPVEQFGKENSPLYPLMGWNEHILLVDHVLKARSALKATE